MSLLPVSVSACSRRVCHRSVSIPPILEGDTDNWDEEEDSLELETKKQSRKRYVLYPLVVLCLSW